MCQGYIAELNCLYPTKYAKFGGSQSLTLVEVMFDNASATKGRCDQPRAVGREIRKIQRCFQSGRPFALGDMVQP